VAGRNAMWWINVQCTSLFLYNCINMVNFVWNFCQLDENSGCLDAGCLRVGYLWIINWMAVS
jgi:hypothetical protein